MPSPTEQGVLPSSPVPIVTRNLFPYPGHFPYPYRRHPANSSTSRERTTRQVKRALGQQLENKMSIEYWKQKSLQWWWKGITRPANKCYFQDSLFQKVRKADREKLGEKRVGAGEGRNSGACMFSIPHSGIPAPGITLWLVNCDSLLQHLSLCVRRD